MSVIDRQKIRRYTETRDVVDFLEALNATARFVCVIRAVKEAPEDDRVLATGYDRKADYIVSGDKHLDWLWRQQGSREHQRDPRHEKLSLRE